MSSQYFDSYNEHLIHPEPFNLHLDLQLVPWLLEDHLPLGTSACGAIRFHRLETHDLRPLTHGQKTGLLN